MVSVSALLEPQNSSIKATNSKTSIRILHVDDDASIREISKQILLDIDDKFDIDQACCVDEAFKKLAVEHYDVVISDYEMPQKDGLQFLKELREKKNDVGFILFTGKGREEVAINALNLGADGYFNKQGSPETVYGELAHGIKQSVEHWKAKRELIERELKYQNIFNNSEVGMLRTNLDGSGFLDCNDKCLSIYGLTREELQGEPSVNFWADPIERQELVRLLKANGSVKDFECKMINKQFGIRTCLTSVKLYPEQGVIEGSIIDITEHKRAEEALADSVAKYRALVENAEDAIMLTDLRGKQIYRNPAYYKSLGFEEGDLPDLSEFARVHPDDLPILKIKMSELLKTGSGTSEYRVRHRDGSWNYRSAKSTVIYNAKRQPYAILIIVRDISERKKFEQALIENEATYRSLINGMDESAWVIDFEGNFLEVNDAAVEMLGYSRDELLSLGIKGIDSYLTKEEVQHLTNQVASGETQVFETAHTTKDGTQIPVEISSSLITYHGKQATLAIARNITERKKAENALKKSEEEYKSLFANMLDGFAYCRMIFDEAGKPVDFVYIQVNEAFERITGLKRDLIVGKKVTQAIPEIKETNPELFEIYGRVALMGKKERFEHELKPLNLWLNVSVYSPAKGYFAAVLEDITQRKKAEEEMSKSEFILHNSSDSIIITNLNGIITYWNRGSAEIFGYGDQEVIGEPITKLLKPADRERVGNVMREQMGKGKTTRGEWEGSRKDGSSVWVMLNSMLIRNSQNEPVALVSFGKDITERKKAEEKLATSEEKFKQAFAIGQDGFLISTLKESTLVDINDRFLEMFGYSKTEVIGKSAIDLKLWANPYDREKIASQVKLGNVTNLEIFCRRKNEEIFPIQLSVSLLQASGQPLVLSTVRDMSCYKKTEAALKQSEVNYKNLIYAMNDAVWVVDHEGNFVDFNDAFVNALGYSREQLLSLGIGSIDNSLNHQQSKEILAKLVRYGHHVFEAIHTAKDGQQIPVEISSSFTTYNGKPVVLNIARNVSERMKAEERLSQIFCQLSLVNEKLGVVGGLTRHDVRNKLSAINSYAYLLKKKHKDQPDIVEGLSKIESAVADSVKIFEFAKMYEQLGVEQLTYIDVGKALDEAVALFSGLTINVVNDCLGRIVLADSFLRQMFYNFVDNTRKYGQKATTVHVYSEQEKSGGLRLIYKDDGVGISLENKKKLFFESFSTGGSTGFGLFFIKKMLDVYGWTITEEGSPGKGAKFIISLPVKR